MKIYGSWSTPDLYYIDFEQPIKTDELKLHRGKKGYFTLEASKRITRKVKRRVRNGQVKERERNARLYIVFAAKTKERTVDYEQLHNQIADLISQLTEN
ncbi:hypothetical protein BWI97_26280 [Siphonobacter sp. BAB-5405]|nr:hypothetical protein BWI97_26280 [Siphonobacter sp. BAB-5405]